MIKYIVKENGIETNKRETDTLNFIMVFKREIALRKNIIYLSTEVRKKTEQNCFDISSEKKKAI